MIPQPQVRRPGIGSSEKNTTHEAWRSQNRTSPTGFGRSLEDGLPSRPISSGARLSKPASRRSVASLLAEEHVGRDHGVWVQGHGVDAPLHELPGQVRVVGGALAADAHVLALLL